MNLRKDRRPTKRRLNHLLKHCQVGKHVEDCRGHPCRVTAQTYYPSDMYGWSISCQSLVDGIIAECSLYHCNPLPLAKADAVARADFIKQHGMAAYYEKYYPAAA